MVCMYVSLTYHHVGISSSQPRSPPSGQFFRVIGVINSQMPLIESLFREVIAPCIK